MQTVSMLGATCFKSRNDTHHRAAADDASIPHNRDRGSGACASYLACVLTGVATCSVDAPPISDHRQGQQFINLSLFRSAAAPLGASSRLPA